MFLKKCLKSKAIVESSSVHFPVSVALHRHQFGPEIKYQMFWWLQTAPDQNQTCLLEAINEPGEEKNHLCGSLGSILDGVSPWGGGLESNPSGEVPANHNISVLLWTWSLLSIISTDSWIFEVTFSAGDSQLGHSLWKCFSGSWEILPGWGSQQLPRLLEWNKI